MQATMRAVLGSLVALGFLSSMSALAATDAAPAPAKYIDDATVTAQVKTALIGSPDVKARQVDVETYRGVVQLNGFVDSAAAKSAATRVAGSVKGVVEVHNNLAVSAEHESIGKAADDSVLTTKVKAALIAEPKTKAGQINVTTKDGVVQLSGFVDSEQEKAKATEVANSIAGVRKVQNEIDIKKGS